MEAYERSYLQLIDLAAINVYCTIIYHPFEATTIYDTIAL